jgi:hypothetical protein
MLKDTFKIISTIFSLPIDFISDSSVICSLASVPTELPAFSVGIRNLESEFMKITKFYRRSLIFGNLYCVSSTKRAPSGQIIYNLYCLHPGHAVL